jgi:hypothetical protein
VIQIEKEIGEIDEKSMRNQRNARKASVALTPNDLREIEIAAAKISVRGLATPVARTIDRPISQVGTALDLSAGLDYLNLTNRIVTHPRR